MGEKKIESLKDMAELQLLLNLLKEFKILNRLVIRMKLLRNITLLETKEWREAVNIIMQIVWKHARIDEDNADMLQHCTAELLFNLLKRENQREFGLKLFLSPTDQIKEMPADTFLITDQNNMDDEEDDLYASSDDDTVAVITGLDNDDDTNLAIALSESQAAAKRKNDGENENDDDEKSDDKKSEETDDAKDDEKEPSSKEKAMKEMEMKE